MDIKMDKQNARQIISNRSAFPLFLLFMIATLLAPVAIFNKLIFFIIFFWTFVIFAKQGLSGRAIIVSPIMIFFVFLYGLILSLINPNDHALAMQLILSSAILFLIHFVFYYNLNIDDAVEICGKIMIGVTLIYWICVLFYDIPGVSDWILWFNEISQSDSAERDYVGNGLVRTFALGSAPFIYLPWCLVLMRLSQKIKWMDFFWAILYAFVIILSGARGIMVISFLFMCYIFISNGSSIIYKFISSFVVMIALISLVLFSISNTMVFGSEETSNAVKIGHFESFLEQLTWVNGLWGNGLGSYYFSSGSGILKSQTELTPIDLVRYVGFPLAFLVYIFLLFPRLHRKFFRKQFQPIIVIFFLYLVLSFTNPVLFNSVGMLVVIWYWHKVLRA